MSTQKEIEESLEAIEAQRGTLLENDVVDIASLALREKLATLKSPTTMQQHEEICVLVADMSGFTTMSEFMDAEEVRDTINAIWRKLDKVILNWGGTIDKHLGDGIIALFGMPTPLDDDARCAVMAALDMQLELHLFNEQEMRRALGTAPIRSERRVQMRVGIHMGPVYFGQVGAADEITAVGDTVTVATALEAAAPVGGILISEPVNERISPFFTTDFHDFYSNGENGNGENGEDEAIQTFVVKEERRQSAFTMGDDLDLGTRFVGRGDELNLLQQALQVSLDNSVTQIVTVVGDAGEGKSRLLYEFERLIALMPEQLCIMKGAGSSDIYQNSFGLIRSLLSSYFNIYPQNTDAIKKEKFLSGVINELDHEFDWAAAVAENIAKLLGFITEDGGTSKMVTKPLTLYWEASMDVQGSHRDIQGEGFLQLADLFTAVSEKHAATILFLEDFHFADERSYDFLDYLVEACRELPLLIVAMTRPSLFNKRPSWRIVESGERREVNLQPLSLIDSRHMLTELLQKVDAMPLRLMDVIVNASGGNPFDIIELVDIFLKEGVLEEQDSHWQANMGRLLDLPTPMTIGNLWRGQIEKLPEEQQAVLQKAAVFGAVFWDAGLLALDHSDSGRPMGAVELDNHLQHLVASGWIQRYPISQLPNTHQYRFRNDQMVDAIYEGLPEDLKNVYHGQVASWLMSQSLPTNIRLLRTIAFHLQQADNESLAAEWYGRAAKQARLHLALETATHYYTKAIASLSQGEEAFVSEIIFNEGNAIVLRKQARFTDSIESYRRMLAAAEAFEDSAAKARAFSGEFLCHFLLEDLRVALDSVRPVESIAKELNDNELLTIASSARGWLALQAGQTKMAGDIARNVFKQSRSLEASPGRAFSRAFVGALACELGRYDQAAEMTKMARSMFASFGESLWEMLLWAQLGQIMQEQWHLDTAVLHYKKCLQIAQNAADRFGTMIALRRLGLMAYYQTEYDQAEIFYQQALTYAEKSQNQVFLAYIATDLGQLFLAQALRTPQNVNEIAQQEESMYQAERWFKRSVRLAQKADRPMKRVLSLAGLGQLNLEDHLIEEALDMAHEAVLLAEKTLQQRPTKANRIDTAVAWRTLGNVLGKVPQKNMTATIRNKKVGASVCYGRSKQLLEEVGSSGELELAKTLRAFALLEFRRDHLQEAAPLANEARELLTKLGRQREAERIRELMVKE